MAVSPPDPQLVQAAGFDVLNRVQNKLPLLSQAEHKLGRLLLDDPQLFSEMSVREIAARAEVSEPTVVRFCRNVGCDGFKDLKFRLVQELAVRQAILDARSNLPGRPGGKRRKAGDIVEAAEADPVEHCFHSAVAALEHVRSAMPVEGFRRAAQVICAAKKVAIYGLGGSSAVMAAEMHNRLFRLGVTSIPYTDSYMQRMSSASLAPEDAAVFISSTGRPRALLDCMDLAKYYGAKCIGIVPADSALARDMDVCLHVELTQYGVHPFQPNPMRFAQLLSIDILAFNVALKLGASAESHLQRTRASVAALHGIAPQQPIGD